MMRACYVSTISLLLLRVAATTGAFVLPSRSNDRRVAPKAAATAKSTTTGLLAISVKESEESSQERATAGAAAPSPAEAASASEESKTNDVVVMSKAIPFIECPPTLVNSELAGNFGFDPLHLAKDEKQLMSYRQAEIKHARLAMLAAVGWPISELVNRELGFFGWPSIAEFQENVAPTVLNAGFQKQHPVFWGAILGLCAATELHGMRLRARNSPNYVPGDLGFDPAGLYPADEAGREKMRLAEIVNGRVAMLAVLGYAVQEFVTNVGVIDETPSFFIIPMSETTAEAAAAVGAAASAL